MSHSKKPISAKKLAANRANAARSTRPQTSEGKARSSQNSRKHGFCSADYAVVRLEDHEAVARLRADLIAAYQPVNSQELFAVERIALAQQSTLRVARLEAGLLTTCLNEGLDPYDNPIRLLDPDITNDIEVTRQQNRNYALGEGFNRQVGKNNSWSLFLRYQAQAERLLRRAVEEFERLKALRHELPNEPNYDPQPEPKPTPSVPPQPEPQAAPTPPPPPPDS